MSAADLTGVPRIELIRCPNGWIAHEADRNTIHGHPLYVFESTEGLARELVRLIGKSGWRVGPKRDAQGHFTK